MWVEIQSRSKRRKKASTIMGEKPENRARIACGLVTLVVVKVRQFFSDFLELLSKNFEAISRGRRSVVEVGFSIS